MQPIRKNFRPTGGAYRDYRPPLLTNSAPYFAVGNSESRPPGPIPGNQRPCYGSRAEVNQPTAFPVGVMAHAVDARGHQTTIGAAEKAEAEKYTALFSRMLQENILLSGASNPQQPSVAVSLSTTRPLHGSPAVQTDQLLTGSGHHQRHPGPVAPNRMSFQGPFPTTRNLTETSCVPVDLLGWTPSSQGLTRKDLPPPPFPRIPMTVLPPPGYPGAPAALPRAVPPVSQYHPLPTTNDLNPPGLRWSTPTSVVSAPVLNAPAAVSACFGRATVAETSSKEVPDVGFLTKGLAGLHPSDILSRVNQMLAQNLFEMTTENPDDNKTTARRCSRDDARLTYSSDRGRSEDGGRRRRRRSEEEEHQRHSTRRRRRSRSRRRRSRSSHSSSSSARSTPSSSSSSSVVSADSNPQYNTAGRNYRNRRDSQKHPKKRKSEFCRICEIKIKGSFLAHRRGKAHIRRESSVQSGCDLCGVRCFNTYSEYESHRSSEEHLQKRSEQQSQIDAENRKRLGLPENKVVIIRNPDGREQEEELAKLDRLRQMAARDRNRKSVEVEKKPEEENSTERNARGTNRPERMSGGTMAAAASPLRGCHGDQRDDVIIDLTGRSEEESGKRKREEKGDLEMTDADAAAADEDKDEVTPMTNHTQVTSTTADKAAKDDCLGREWVVPVTGFFCKVCLKFFSANSGESDVTAHCTSARHRDNYQEQMPKTKLIQPSSSSSSFPSSSITPPSSSSPNAGRCGIVYDENKQVKEIIIWKNTNEQNS